MTTSFGAEDTLAIPAKALRRRERRFRGAILLAAALLAALVVALIVATRDGAPEPRFRLAPVARRSIASVVEASGTIDARARAEVPAPSAGVLAKVLTQRGARVKAGDLLAELDPSAASIAVRGAGAAVAAASGSVAEARAALTAAKDALARLERLRERGLAAEAEITAANANAQKAQAALEAAEGQRAVASQDLAAARLTRRTLELHTPIDGVVLRAPESTGSIVRPEQGALFVIGSPLDVVRIDAQVAEADIGQVRPGQRVSFTVPAHAGRTFEAELVEIGLEGTRSGGAVLYPVRLKAPNPEGLLLPGMSARVFVHVATAENVLAVRDAALRFSPDGSAEPSPRPRVWVSRDGVDAESVDVEVGVSDGVFTQVTPLRTGALSPGDEVVIGQLATATDDDSGPGIRLRSRP